MNFITGAGGFLQSLIFGTGGMRISRGALTFNPPPPSATGTNATRLVVHSFHYLGSRLRQDVTTNATTYELLEAGPMPLSLSCGGGAKVLRVGAPQTVGRVRCSVQELSDE